MSDGKPVPKYPNATEQFVLHTEEGNAHAILGRTRSALYRAGATPEELDAFCEEAFSGDYKHLLDTVRRWITVEFFE